MFLNHFDMKILELVLGFISHMELNYQTQGSAAVSSMLPSGKSTFYNKPDPKITVLFLQKIFKTSKQI